MRADHGAVAWRVDQRAALPCAVCNEPMETLVAYHTAIDRCAQHGMWFDADELARILLAAGETRPQAVVAPPNQVSRSRQQQLESRTHGGARKGAGRKPAVPGRPRLRHAKRRATEARYPVHVTHRVRALLRFRACATIRLEPLGLARRCGE